MACLRLAPGPVALPTSAGATRAGGRGHRRLLGPGGPAGAATWPGRAPPSSGWPARPSGSRSSPPTCAPSRRPRGPSPVTWRTRPPCGGPSTRWWRARAGRPADQQRRPGPRGPAGRHFRSRLPPDLRRELLRSGGGHPGRAAGHGRTRAGHRGQRVLRRRAAALAGPGRLPVVQGGPVRLHRVDLVPSRPQGGRTSRSSIPAFMATELGEGALARGLRRPPRLTTRSVETVSRRILARAGGPSLEISVSGLIDAAMVFRSPHAPDLPPPAAPLVGGGGRHNGLPAGVARCADPPGRAHRV